MLLVFNLLQQILLGKFVLSQFVAVWPSPIVEAIVAEFNMAGHFQRGGYNSKL